MNGTPNTALQRTRVRPAGGRSPLSFETFGVTRLVAVGVAFGIGLCGCSSPAEAPGAERLLTPERYGDVRQYEGVWQLGFEVNQFQPCGSTEKWAVWPSPKQASLVRERIGKVGSQDVPAVAFFLRSRGQVSGAGHPDWKGERRLLLTDVLELRPTRDGDCVTGGK
jgi:hypothetical protein